MRYAVARQPMKQREERPSSLGLSRGAKEEDNVNRRQAESHEFAQWPKREGGRPCQFLASSIASTPSPVFA